ncbi:MAG TPA: response regulator [Thermodesulfobacteriota bacterium]|nr:response regulator [Thermodesulfobacteriota bacterium]
MFTIMAIVMKANCVKRVALIEDNSSERRVLRGLIEDMGYEVVGEGADFDSALKACREAKPDIVVMDVGLPGRDGIEAAGEINRVCPTAILLVTGAEDEETVKRAVQAGVMGYLVKPVGGELRPAMELAMSRFREFDELRKENQDLKNTIESRKIIEKAKGLLMEKEKISEAEAFSKIRRISMDNRKTMREVAEVIIALEAKAG